jgi:hypothetical protein
MKKYNTASVLISESTVEDSNATSSLPVCSSSPNARSESKSRSPNRQTRHLDTYINSMSECLPQQTVGATQSGNQSRLNTSNSSTASSSSPLSSSPHNTNPAGTVLSMTRECSAMQGLPVEVRARLYSIFGQIEREFDQIYAENARLKLELQASRAQNERSSTIQSLVNTENTSVITNSSSTSTLVANHNATVNNNSGSKLSVENLEHHHTIGGIKKSASLKTSVSPTCTSNVTSTTSASTTIAPILNPSLNR